MDPVKNKDEQFTDPATEDLGGIVNKGVDTVAHASDIADDLLDANVQSLSDFVKGNIIQAPVFIDETLNNSNAEDATVNTVKALHRLYINFIIMTMNLQSRIDGMSYKKLLRPIATESFDDATVQELDDLVESQLGIDVELVPATEEQKGAAPKSTILGEVVELVIRRGSGNGKEVKLQVIVQLHQHFIPVNVVEEFISLNISPTTHQLWLQYKAGMIKFWSGLVLGIDRAERRAKAIKNDKTGVLKYYGNRVTQNARKGFLNLFHKKDNRSRNAICHFLIFDQSRFDMICKKNNIRMDVKEQREKYMVDAKALFLCTVDPMYNTVTIHCKGLESTTMKFSQLKGIDKKSDSKDLMQFLQMMAGSGKLPTF